MNATEPIRDTETYRDKIATVDERGKRLWISPKKPSGRFYNARTYLSWVLLAVLFLTPFIKVNGDPLLLFNVLERRFILFSIPFAPQDFHLFVLAMLTLMVFIVLFTVVFGRLFCGWVCPQTIFMEMVFRKIEYWIEGDANAQRKLNQSAWTSEKMLKKGGKVAIFYAISVLIANTFLAYIIGIDEVIRIATEPLSMHLGGFSAMLIFSAVFYFVFAYMREQVCIVVCPYGRLQGVLLDHNSIVVAYDFVRGEPRGKLKKNQSAANPLHTIQETLAVSDVAVAGPEESRPIEMVKNQLGDCIDCKLCVQVCPTGIDIRNGTQLECINCTACIDACDEVMDKIKKPRGLIRYDSHKGITEKRNRIFTGRVVAYSVVLSLLVLVNIFLLGSRSNVETLVLRTPGMLFQDQGNGYLSNLYNYEVINKTNDVFPIEFRLADGRQGRIKPVGKIPSTKPGDIIKGAFFIELPKDQLKSRKNDIEVEVYSNGKLIDRVSTTFLGPMQ